MIRTLQKPIHIRCDSCHWDGGVWMFEEDRDGKFEGMYACMYCGWFEKWFERDATDLMVGYMGLIMFNKARRRTGRTELVALPGNIRDIDERGCAL